jgi:myosin heavy subunit
MSLADPKIREVYNRYLKYHQGEAFLFGKKGNYAENKFVWVATAKDEYSTAEVVSESNSKMVVRTEKGEDHRFKERTNLPAGEEFTIDKEKAEYLNPPKFDGCEDCAELGYLSEAAVLHNLRKRYSEDIIYVS